MDALILRVVPRLLGVAVTVTAGFYLLHYAYFVLLPRLAAARYREADPERLRRYLERVAATPSLFGAGQKLVARLVLVDIDSRQGRHAEVVSRCRACLDNLPGPSLLPGRFRTLEAAFRSRLADSLDALGRRAEATEERRRATALIDGAQPGAERCLEQGKRLERQHRYEEAYERYLRALDDTPTRCARQRIECINHLALAAHRAGRPADCLRWAEVAIALASEARFLGIAHRLAALACGSLSRLDDAERHLREAYDLAVAADDRPAAAENLAQLANCLRKRGQLAAAADACARAAAFDPNAERMALGIQAQIFRDLGRYDDALAAIRRHRHATPMALPQHEQRLRAAGALDAARIAAECGRGADAWEYVQEALTEFSADARLGFQCESALALVHAARGDAAESQRLAALLESRLADFDRDPGTRRAVLYDLGMAAATRGDHPAGVRHWTEYLALHPDPVYHPVALYHRGECHRHLGRLDAARADFEAAVAAEIDCHCAGLARRRLSELLLL